MLHNLTGWHFLIIVAVILLLFGAPKLPALARSIGQSMHILRSEVGHSATADETADVATGANAAATADPASTTIQRPATPRPSVE